MTRLKARPATWATVLVTILSWLAISNHCALGAIAASVSSPAGDEQCPMHSQHKPAKKDDARGMLCCKILRAIGASTAKNFAHTMVDLRLVDLVFAKLIVLAPPKISFASAELDTGPPGKTSLAQLIGSVRAHAPPYMA